jgi:hypothetical protein
MFTIGQNGKLRFGSLNAECGLILWLDGQGDDLCSLFFKLGMVLCQPTELVCRESSVMSEIENQDDHSVVIQFIGQVDHIPVAVGQGEVGGYVPGARGLFRLGFLGWRHSSVR